MCMGDMQCGYSGCMRITVSLCVILLELTNNLNLLPLTMLVLLVAKVGTPLNKKSVLP